MAEIIAAYTLPLSTNHSKPRLQSLAFRSNTNPRPRALVLANERRGVGQSPSMAAGVVCNTVCVQEL